MKALLIPLDERPCNYNYPIIQSEGCIDLLLPPKDLLSNKKQPANINKLWEFIFDNVKDKDGIIICAEMAIYGGLLPSRLHHNTYLELKLYVDKIKSIKEMYPNIKLYVSNLIMRTPSYSSSEEEPDYYNDYGEQICTYGRLLDQKNRIGLNHEEELLLTKLLNEIPKQFLDDYTNRRNVNLMITKDILQLVYDNIIDELIIPQDDSAPFGFTAIDQKIVRSEIENKDLFFKVQMYPGADEAACTLVSKMVNTINNTTPKVFVYYSSVDGKNTIPKYEDRSFGESIKAHIISQNALLTQDYNDADYYLMVNISSTMCESWEQNNRDISYDIKRNLLDFVYQIQYLINNNKKVILCDVAYSNGGDIQLIKMLRDKNLLNKLESYAGWNTACNTLGTALSAAFLNNKNKHTNIIYRFIEDVCYQSIVRQKAIKEILPKYNTSYYDFNNKETDIIKEITLMLEEQYNTLFKSSFPYLVSFKSVYMPWHRMFEIGLELEINKE